MDSFQTISLLGLGLVLGLKHALDADHIIAVSTIVNKTKNIKTSSLIGAWWGMGHAITLFIAGAIILGLRLAIPEKLALSFEFAVGAMLVALGIRVLREIKKEKIHIHAHKHGQSAHAHAHSHKRSNAHNHAHTPFIIGMVHGLAGSAGLMLLILAATTSLFQGLLFILIFGAGSLFGMLIVSAAISLPFVFMRPSDALQKNIQALVGLFSVAFGFFIMYHIGFAGGLFI